MWVSEWVLCVYHELRTKSEWTKTGKMCLCLCVVECWNAQQKNVYKKKEKKNCKFLCVVMNKRDDNLFINTLKINVQVCFIACYLQDDHIYQNQKFILRGRCWIFFYLFFLYILLSLLLGLFSSIQIKSRDMCTWHSLENRRNKKKNAYKVTTNKIYTKKKKKNKNAHIFLADLFNGFALFRTLFTMCQNMFSSFFIFT